MADQLHVRINSPEKIIWEGDAEWVSSENSQGPFDILPMHANFVSIIEKHDIRVKTAEGEVKYTFPYSVIYAHSNQVKIYTNL
jgi:F0F1-type ATP synthase epsilon subunit